VSTVDFPPILIWVFPQVELHSLSNMPQLRHRRRSPEVDWASTQPCDPLSYKAGLAEAKALSEACSPLRASSNELVSILVAVLSIRRLEADWLTAAGA